MTTAGDIENHIKHVIQINNVKVTKLTSKSENPTFASFYVVCNHSDTELLKDPKNWPTGTMINRYYKPFQSPPLLLKQT